MFVESKIEDSIKISPLSVEKEDNIYKVLKNKFSNYYIKDLGLGIFVKKDFLIFEKKCIEDFVLCKIRFNVIFFRFLKHEILKGVVTSQNESGIYLSVLFYNKIFVPATNLPDYSETTFIYDQDKNKKLAWVWLYKNNKFYVRNNDSVTLKIIEYDETNKCIIASFNDFGLGPITWWQ